MPEIILRDLTKRFGNSVAVDSLNLEIEDRAFVTLLGPSGCGKTTTLRMIAGLETPTSGEIYINNKLVFSSKKGIDVSPDKRDVGFLFQNYALWPHMTVYQNISFGLENMKWSKAEIQQRIEELVVTLKIKEYLERYPAELSGGQQQRVAIARTLATGPKTLFMDEPLSNLDAKLRMEMRTELKRLHLETDSTFVYVTHDQLEAMTLSTRICLLRNGILQQYDPPLKVYRKPTNSFAADFVGSPNINLVEVTGEQACQNQIRITAGELNLLFTSTADKLPQLDGKAFVLGIRPEYIRVTPAGNVSATVYSTLPSGMETIVKLQTKDMLLTSVVFGGKDFSVNEEIKFDFDSEDNILFDARTGKNIAHGSLVVA